VIAAQITITTSDTRRSETYRLVTSVLDPAVCCPPLCVQTAAPLKVRTSGM